MDETNSTTAHSIRFKKQYLPWLLLVILVGALFFLGPFAYWRSSGVGPQVQVPMFYDAHYLYPRPWTQEQSVPGVPEPAPIAIYGDNSVSQSFIAGSDNLARISFNLAESGNGIVHVSLDREDGNYWGAELNTSQPIKDGQFPFFASREVSVSFPPQEDSKGKKYTLTITAPDATAEQPIVLHTVGGDRLGDSLHLNEFIRPGNLAITTYSRGSPGLWWFDALGEQILPSVFRLRLQQYKASLFKGDFFIWTFLITAGLSAALLVLSSPNLESRDDSFWSRFAYVSSWFLVSLAGFLLVWQIGSGRAQLVTGSKNITAVPISENVAKQLAYPHLETDLISDLWTAVREPEARFISTEMSPYPAIVVPGDSRIEYSLIVSPDSRLRIARAAEGNGLINFAVKVNGEHLLQQDIAAQGDSTPKDLSWQELDLGPWAGQDVILALETSLKEGSARGLWLMPQIETDGSWILSAAPDEYLPVHVRFNDSTELLGIMLDDSLLQSEGQLRVQLLWRSLQNSDRYGKVFVHLLDENNELIAQHDAPPVQGAYPFTNWQPGTIIQDEHLLQVDSSALTSGPFYLEIGIYDPDTLERWVAKKEGGLRINANAAILALPSEVLP